VISTRWKRSTETPDRLRGGSDASGGGGRDAAGSRQLNAASLCDVELRRKRHSSRHAQSRAGQSRLPSPVLWCRGLAFLFLCAGLDAHAGIKVTALGGSERRGAPWARKSLLCLTVTVFTASIASCSSVPNSVPKPPAEFGFTRVRGAPGCYKSAVLAEPRKAIDSLRDYYELHGFGGIPSAGLGWIRHNERCGFVRHELVPPRRPNAYGWVGTFDPAFGDLSGISAWVVPENAHPARIYLAIFECSGCNLP
jgi:hypothetical protein